MLPAGSTLVTGWRLAVISILAAMALAPAADAEPFTATLPFTDFSTASHLPFLSGTFDGRSPAGGSPAVLHRVDAFKVDELEVVCWEYPCHESTGSLAVRVAANSTVALRFPTAGILHLRADHAVSLPVRLDAEKNGFGELAAALQLAPSLAIAAEGGRLSVLPEEVQPAPAGTVPVSRPPGTPPQLSDYFSAPDPSDEDAAVLASLTPGSRLEVVDGGRVVHAITGYGALLLQGGIHVEPVAAEAYVLPCAVRCDVQVTDTGVAADLEAATTMVLNVVALALGVPAMPLGFGPFAEVLNPMAAGVLVDFPLLADPTQFSVSNLSVIRFDVYEVSFYPGAPAAPGDGPLVIQSGSVQGSPEFVGGPYFGMPLWSYILWGLAIIAVVVAAAVRAKKESRWDHLRWIGRIAGLVALAALVVVWHLNFSRVIGVDALSPGLDAEARGLVAAVEVGTLLAMMAMVVLPARLLLSRALRLAGQGRFMGLAGPLASVVGILAGTPLLLGFVDLALRFFP